MSTSLKEQLERLTVPQTSALIDRSSRASILFDSKEAATKDRRKIYDLGLTGLEELITLNTTFSQFETTLFDEAAIDLVRAVEQSNVNELLNKNIKKFLQHLSPYFLLRPAHLCIEWLLRRFEIHSYNRDELLALALPYHETNIFVRILQVLQIRESDKDWNWLRPLQKPGLTLPKSVIINRAGAHVGFLKFLADSTISIFREFGSRANLLQTQINFFTTVVVGTLENIVDFREWHISTLLGALLYTLNSKVVDVAAAGYIITAQLIAKTQLKKKLCNTILDRVISVSFEELRPPAVMLLILIFDVQQSAPTNFSEKALNIIIDQKWLIPVLAALVKQNIDVYPLFATLLRDSVKAIQSGHEDEENFKRLAIQLLNDVDVPKITACHLISCFLDCFIYETSKNDAPKLKDGDIIDLDSDDDDDEEMPESVRTSFSAWYSEYLRKLEQKYPDAFDLTLKESLRSGSEATKNRKMSLKIAMRYRLKISNENAMDIYESLYHHNAQLRLLAMQTLLQNLSNYQTRFQNVEILKACLADRLCDDSCLVLHEVLKLPTKDFIDILGHEKFAAKLFDLLDKIQKHSKSWNKLMPSLVKHLTSTQLLNGFDVNLVLLALIPLLFPTDENVISAEVIEEILKSNLAMKFSFLKKLENISTLKPNDARMKFLSIFDDPKNAKSLPKPNELFASVEKKGIEYFKQASQLSNFLILLTVSLKRYQTAAESLKMFEYIETFVKEFKIKNIQTQQKADWENVISLRIYADFLIAMVRCTNFEELQCWNKSLDTGNIEIICFLRLFKLIGSKIYNAKKSQESKIWICTLKEFFNSIFPNTQMKIDFLTNFYINTDLQDIEHCTAVDRLLAFKVINSILNQKSDYTLNLLHILKIGNSLNSQYKTIRTIALETFDIIHKKCEKLDENLKYLVENILQFNCEIIMDKDQYPLILYLVLNTTKRKSNSMHQITNEILKLFENPTDIYFIRQLLNVMDHFNDKKTIAALIPLALKCLECVIKENNNDIMIILEPYNHILITILQRFQPSTIESILQESKNAWELFNRLFEKYNVFMHIDGRELQPLPCAFLQTFNKELYENLSQKNRLQLIKLILHTEALSQNDSLSLTAHKLLKHCTIDCKPLISILQQMYSIPDDSEKSKRSTISATKPLTQPISIEWKIGVALLELLEHKDYLLNAEQLIPTLFELLTHCLKLEEEANIEYTKQLILNTLLHCCRFAEKNQINLQKTCPETVFRIDRIVQCVRATQNPQTHQNALTLLSHCAGQFPQEVLHNVVDIFTFMGSSVVRQDDAFSFHIIDNIIVSIIPILVQSDQKQAESNSVIPVLKVFSDIMLDVPDHRRILLYTKLMNTLGAELHFWRFLCIVFEAHVIAEEKLRLMQRKEASGVKVKNISIILDKKIQRIDFIMSLSNAFPPKVILETCTQLLNYLKNSLPLSKGNDDDAIKSTKRKSSNEFTLFDVNQHSDKLLRHFKYSIMIYLSNVSKTPELLRKIALLNDTEMLEMKPFFQNFIISILAYVPIANAAAERFDDPLQSKFWKVILHNLHDILDNAISLLSSDMFLVVIIGLMQHQYLSIRKKVIELLITKMQSQAEEDINLLSSCDVERFKEIFKPLNDIVDGIIVRKQQQNDDVTPSNELVLLQQIALIAIKLLSKHFALKYIDDFKNILANLTTIVMNRANIPKIVLASVVLALIEIASNLKAHSLEKLPKFMPHLIELLQQQAETVRENPPDHVCYAILTGFQKLFESLPRFLGPYIVDIVSALSSIATRITRQQNKKDQRSIAALGKISTTWTRIASQVLVRVLVPCCEKSYKNLMDSHCYDEIEQIMKLLNESILKANAEDLVPVQIELRSFFLSALAFRWEMKDKKYLDLNRIAIIESTIIDAFVSYILKLSESAFRPLYENFYEWAIKNVGEPETQLTYFLLSSRIGIELKSLFVIFATTFLQDAANLLEACNTSKSSIDAQNETIRIELVKAILSTLYQVFLYANNNFMNIHRFEMLMPKVVDQLENRLTLENDSIQKLLNDCIAQLAVAVSNDVMWKQVNYQVLLKTRTNVPEVRILSFNCCVEIARKLGDEFTSLLPETVSFIAELFEDENSRVEQNTRKSVQELENILGESLQKYL